ncbi:MAG: ArnT family glycosyltransferase [Opitutales bacterium]
MPAPLLESGLLALSCLLVGVGAQAGLACRPGGASRDPLLWLVSWLTAGASLITASLLLANWFGILHLVGVLGLQAGLTLLLVALSAGVQARATIKPADPGWFRATVHNLGYGLRTFDREDRVHLVLISLVLAGFGLTAAWAPPLVQDSHAYRLPRIAHWLQEGRIGHFPTLYPAQNYVSRAGDLLQAWLLLPFSLGYPLVRLVQWIGGVLLLCSLSLVARDLGWGRRQTWMVLWLTLGCAPLAMQAMTSQTDLTATAWVVASVALTQRAWRRGRLSVVGMLAGGLALGTKGTVYFFIPGLALIGVFLIRRWQPGWRRAGQQAAGVCAVWLVLAGPVHWENLRSYGHPLGAPSWIERHAAPLETPLINLGAYAVQLLEPGGNPYGLDGLLAWTGEVAASRLPDPRAGRLEDVPRRLLGPLMNNRAADPDVTAFGVLLPVFWLLGLVRCLHRSGGVSPPVRRASLWFSGAVGSFFLLFILWHAWFPYAYRFFILVVPWMALTGSLVVCGPDAPGTGDLRSGLLARSALILWQGLVLIPIFLTSPQVGWAAILRPSEAGTHQLREAQVRLSHELHNRVDGIVLALPAGRAVSGYYRNGTDLPVAWVTDRAAAGFRDPARVGDPDTEASWDADQSNRLFARRLDHGRWLGMERIAWQPEPGTDPILTLPIELSVRDERGGRLIRMVNPYDRAVPDLWALTNPTDTSLLIRLEPAGGGRVLGSRRLAPGTRAFLRLNLTPGARIDWVLEPLEAQTEGSPPLPLPEPERHRLPVRIGGDG